MTPRKKFIMALEGKPPLGRIPHFELAFFLTMEAFGSIHPCHRQFSQWDQMSKVERKLQKKDIAELYVKIARTYEHSGIFVQDQQCWTNRLDYEMMDTLSMIREMTGMQYYLTIHGDATFGMPEGDMMCFIEKITDNPKELKEQADQNVDAALKRAELYQGKGLIDGFALCTDYCFNAGPFLSPEMFDEFVTPYLSRLTEGYRQMGFYVIKHTDGNIMPILDSLVSMNPHALHSLDPQAGIDIAEIKKKIGKKMCLIGNVNCGLMDTGTDEEVIESAKYALKNGSPGGGYIFSTSNCVYTGMPLKRYEMILDVWRQYESND